jgi:hypothetical protein
MADEDILKLVREITLLPHPIEFKMLLELFSKFSDVEKASASPTLAFILSKLKSLNTLITKKSAALSQLQEYHSEQQRAYEIQSQQIQVKLQIKALDTELNQLNLPCNELYRVLEDDFNTIASHQYSCSDINLRRSVINEYIKFLTANIQRNNAELAKYQLVTLKSDFDRLTGEKSFMSKWFDKPTELALRSFQTSIEKIRADFKLLPENDYLLPTLAEKQNKEADLKILRVETELLSRKLNTCHNYLEKAQFIVKKYTQCLELKSQLESLEKQLPPNLTLLKSHLEVLEAQIASLDKEIEQHVESISHLEISDTAAKESMQQQKPTVTGSSDQMTQPIKACEKLHEKILLLLPLYPQNIHDWYKALYKSILNSAQFKDPIEVNRVSYLLRDILFEMEQKNDMEVLEAYMRMCPSPETDLGKLLSLKPAVSFMNDPFNNGTDLDHRHEKIKEYYLQYIRLKKLYPVDAELYLHCLQILHLAYLTSSLRQDYMPKITQDPRYMPLRRHRGILYFWEFFEDLIRTAIGKLRGLQAYQYTHIPCFFKPHSIELLEEFETQIQAKVEN